MGGLNGATGHESTEQQDQKLGGVMRHSGLSVVACCPIVEQ